jgi:hypothetical protein
MRLMHVGLCCGLHSQQDLGADRESLGRFYGTFHVLLQWLRRRCQLPSCNRAGQLKASGLDRRYRNVTRICPRLAHWILHPLLHQSDGLELGK